MARGGAKLGTSVLDLDVDDSRFHSKLSGAAKAAQNFTSQAGTSLAKAGKAISGVGDTMTRNVTLPILAAGGAVSKFALDFDTALRQTVGLAGVSEDAIGGIREELLKLGPEVGKSPQELAEAFYFVASAGFEADEAMVVLRTSAKAAASGLGDTQTIAKVLGGVINAYGKENISASKAADILTEAVAQGTAEASGFASVIGNVVPGAAALGVSFDQVTAAMSGMTLSGVGVEESATSLTQIFSSLQKPTQQAEDALKGLGTSSAELRRQLREEGLLSTLRTLEERFAGNEVAAAAVFGNIRALRGVTALLGLDSEQLNDVFAEVADSTGRLGEAYDATEGPQRELDRSMAELQTTAIEIGEDVLPLVVEVLGKVADAAAGLSDWWGTLDDETKQLIVQALAFLAVAGPVLIIVGKLTTGVGNLFKAAAFLSGAKGIPLLIGKTKGLNTAMGGLLGPIGLVAVAIGTLIVVSAEFTRSSEYMAGALDSLAARAGKSRKEIDREIQELADDTGISFEQAQRSVLDYTDNLGLGIEDAIRMVREIPPEVGRSTGEISDALAKSGTDWEVYQKQISGGTAEAVDAAALEASRLPPEVAALLTDGAPKIGAAVDLSAEEIADALQKAKDDGVKAMQDMLNSIGSLLADTPATFQAEIDAIYELLISPYKDLDRRTDLEVGLAMDGIVAAIKSGDTQTAEAAFNQANNWLAQYEVLEPGALAAGALLNPALKAGIDSNLQAMLDWAKENVVGDYMDQFGVPLSTALDALGYDSLAAFARGVERADTIELANATTDAAAGVTAAMAIDLFDQGRSAGDSWINGYNYTRTRAEEVFYAYASAVRGILPDSEPKDPNSPWRGITKIGGSAAMTIIDGWAATMPAAHAAVTSWAAAMVPDIGSVSIPSMPGLAGIGARASGMGVAAGSVSNVTNNWILNVEGAERTVSTKREALDELERMSTSWG